MKTQTATNWANIEVIPANALPANCELGRLRGIVQSSRIVAGNASRKLEDWRTEAQQLQAKLASVTVEKITVEDFAHAKARLELLELSIAAQFIVASRLNEHAADAEAHFAAQYSEYGRLVHQYNNPEPFYDADERRRAAARVTAMVE